MITFKRLDHIQLCVPTGCEAEARAFYCDILGFIEIPKPKALIPNGGFWLQTNTTPPIEVHIGTEDDIGQSKRHPAFEIDNIIQARAYLDSHQVRIKEETAIPNVERFSFFDPWGNRIELLEKHS